MSLCSPGPTYLQNKNVSYVWNFVRNSEKCPQLTIFWLFPRRIAVSLQCYAVPVLNMSHFWLRHNFKHIKTHPGFAQCPSFNSTPFSMRADSIHEKPFPPPPSSWLAVERTWGGPRLAVGDVSQASHVFSGRIGSGRAEEFRTTHVTCEVAPLDTAVWSWCWNEVLSN